MFNLKEHKLDIIILLLLIEIMIHCVELVVDLDQYFNLMYWIK